MQNERRSSTASRIPCLNPRVTFRFRSIYGPIFLGSHGDHVQALAAHGTFALGELDLIEGAVIEADHWIMVQHGQHMRQRARPLLDPGSFLNELRAIGFNTSGRSSSHNSTAGSE